MAHWEEGGVQGAGAESRTLSLADMVAGFSTISLVVVIAGAVIQIALVS